MTTEDSDHDDDYVVEESPCGRWHRRRQTVSYSAVPGIDAAFMAMDMDEGLEVIWNEVTFSESKDYQAQEKQMKSSLDTMIAVTHANIVKFHHYWVKEPKKEATSSEPIKVVFITEYTSSGTLRSFLRKTNAKNWSKWCNQLLSALHYMHNLNTVHGNLTTDTIFLQHQGLIKIGCFSITMMRNYVKTNAEEHNHLKNSWYFPSREDQSPRFDIYSFGVIALEMLIPGLINKSDVEKGKLGQDAMMSRLEEYASTCCEDDRDKCEFIKLCLHPDSNRRPDAKTLSRHEALFTLSQLRILAAHAVHEYRDIYSREGKYSLDYIVKKHKKEEDDNPKKEVCYTVRSGVRIPYSVKDLPTATGDLDKLVLDVENGLYPISGRDQNGANNKSKLDTILQLPGELPRTTVEVEDRRAAHIECYITRGQNDQLRITIDVDLARTLLQDDESKTLNRTPECKRHLQTTLNDGDDAQMIARELAEFAFISYEDVEVMTLVIQDQYDLMQHTSS